MGLWHGVEYYEEEKLKNEPWKASWNEVTDTSMMFTCHILVAPLKKG